MPARGTRRTRHTEAKLSRRTRTVLVALLGAMTICGGGLWLLGGEGMPRVGGMTLPALVGTRPASFEAIFQTRSPLERERWQAIVIHHSGSPVGSPSAIDAEHRNMNLTGMGYHFLIGNGAGMGNGEIHVGRRWLDQSAGAHVAGPEASVYNRASVGICLVGNGERRPFTEEQMLRLAQLVATLAREFGIPDDRILVHSDVAEVASPGRYFPHAAFRQLVAAQR